jgi:glutathione S-transferase
MITIYHLENSRSERMIWLMEELALPYELQRFPREPVTMMAPAAYRALHPIGKSPIISDGATVLIESGAIVEYIVNRYGNGRLTVPVDSPDYARFIQWMHFSEGTAMTQLLVHIVMGGFIAGVDQSLPFVVYTKERSTQLLKILDDELSERPYFAGSEFTAADIMMTYCFGTASGFLQLDMSPYLNIRAYLARIEQRPAYRKGMSIANPQTRA